MTHDPPKHSRIRRTASALLAGILSVIPVLATIWILVLVYKILGEVGEMMIDALYRFLNTARGVEPGSPDEWAFEFPGVNLVLALLPVLILLLVGFAVTNAPGRRLLEWVEAKIEKLPLLGFIYSSIKQLVDALKGLGSERKFKGVAFIEYPSPGCRLVGFVTGGFHDEQRGKDVTSIFLPTAPNPLTGFVVLVEDEKVMNSDMSLEQASKLILSAGLVAPAPGEDGKPVLVPKSPGPEEPAIKR